MIEVRDAVASDADAVCSLIRRSIAELCGADHHGDPAILGRWLASKTPDNVVTWIKRPDASLLVATEAQTVLAAGGVTDAGEITLNYVSPETRFQRASHALLQALERRAVARGSDRCFLHSTETARRFYLSRGYVETGAPVHNFGASGGYPMSKRLRSSDET